MRIVNNNKYVFFYQGENLLSSCNYSQYLTTLEDIVISILHIKTGGGDE